MISGSALSRPPAHAALPRLLRQRFRPRAGALPHGRRLTFTHC